eukprot:9174712-Heterocapsa_arctica.AAC.1
MDANVGTNRSRVLRGALRTGRWHDLAVGEDEAHTYSKDPAWDRVSVSNSSRIDYIIVNNIAKLAFVRFRRVLDAGYKGHVPIEAAF